MQNQLVACVRCDECTGGIRPSLPICHEESNGGIHPSLPICHEESNGGTCLP